MLLPKTFLISLSFFGIVFLANCQEEAEEVGLGSPCASNEVCKEGLPGEHSVCNFTSDGKGFCECAAGAVSDLVNGGDHCFPRVTKIDDDPCEIDEQCPTELTTCSQLNDSDWSLFPRACKCKENYIPNFVKEKCLLKNVLIGASCEEAVQCVDKENSVCDGIPKHCDCRRDFVPSQNLNRCLNTSKKLEDSCQEAQQCTRGVTGPHSDCIFPESDQEKTGKCSCPEETSLPFEKDNVCLAKAFKVGDPCQNNIQCISNNSFCAPNATGYTCQCEEGYVTNAEKLNCFKKLSLSEPCYTDAQCDHLGFPASCQYDKDTDTNTCQCAEGYIQPSDKSIMCNAITYAVGGKCDVDENQCTGIGGEGASCDEAAKTCQCVGDNIPSVNLTKCLTVEKLKGKCEEDIQCQENGAICKLEEEEGSKVCRCDQQTFVESDSGESCVKIVRKNEGDCTDHSQCTAGLSKNSHCDSGKCKCLSSYQFYGEDCYLPKKLNETCEKLEECHLGVNNLTVCNDVSNKCECFGDNREYQMSCYKPTKIGGFCRENNDCLASILGGVHCSNATKSCTCNPGSKPAMENRYCQSGGVKLYGGYLIYGLIGILLMIKL